MPRTRSDRARSTQSRTRWRRFVDALQSNQNFEYLYWTQVCLGMCFDWTLRLMGPLLLLFATALISGVIAMYFKFVLPAAATFGSIPYLLHATWALFVSFNIFFNYYHCAFTHPGKPELFLPSNCMSDSDEDATEDDEEAATRPLVAEGAATLRVNAGGNSDGTGSAEGAYLDGNANRGSVRGGRSSLGRGRRRVRCGYCKKCKGPKPARSHHCHVCDECVLNMDHHCPWMNNCVGYLNYRYFVLFLMYMFMGCVYAVLISAPQFISMAKTPARRHRKSPSASAEISQQSAVMMTFVLALSVGVAISVLLGWHLYLICTAQTTIEFYQNQTNRSRARQWGELWSNPYDVGCKGNWQSVFGPQPFLVALLPSRRAPPPPVVEFFPLEVSDDDAQDRRHTDFADAEEEEWTVDESASGQHMV
eukprot:g14063.t1